jgi:nucleotide-binding universal stress UspA family protein
MIIAVAKREQIDAVVMGRRGAGVLAASYSEAFSQKMASLAPCAVIIVPGSSDEHR